MTHKVFWIVLVILAATTTAATTPSLIAFRDISAADFATHLVPLSIIALFLERALEVFVATARGHAQAQLERDARAAAGTPKATVADSQLAGHKHGTQHLALLIGVTVGVLVAMLGVRALEPLLDADMLAGAPALQMQALRVIDVLLTGALLGGGADGIHKIVSLVTRYMEETKRGIQPTGGTTS